VMQQQNYTVNEPVTTMTTAYMNQVTPYDQVTQTAPTTSYRCGWIPAGFQTTPVAAYRHAGFGRIPVTTPGQTVVNRVYVPSTVAVQVPQTQMVQRVVTQDVPVTVQKYVDGVVETQVPVTVQRIEYEDQVRQIPYKTRKPVTEQVAYKYNVNVTRYEKVEVREPIKITTQRVVQEEHDEPFTVRVMKMVEEPRTVRKPVLVKKVVPYTYYKLTPRTVAMTMPVSACDACGGEVIMGPVVEQRPAVQVQRVESSRASGEPTPAETKIKEKSALKKDDQKKKEPADQQPDLNKPANGDKEKDETSQNTDGPEV